jgi:hypothetical protein
VRGPSASLMPCVEERLPAAFEVWHFCPS